MQHTRAVPRGRVLSYGALGAKCEPPLSGYICGRVLAQVLDDVPWWRIVGKEGTLPIVKRGPHLAGKQRELLSAEGVEFEADGRIMRRFFDD